MNPLLPAWYDLLWSGITVALLALTVVAFVSFFRTPLDSRLQALGWALLILLVPVVGPTAWFALGRPAARARHARG